MRSSGITFTISVTGIFHSSSGDERCGVIVILMSFCRVVLSDRLVARLSSDRRAKLKSSTGLEVGDNCSKHHRICRRVKILEVSS